MNPIIKKCGINWGLFMGLVMIVLGAVAYAMNLYGNMMFGIFNFVLGITLMCVMMYSTRKQMGNVMTFKEGFTLFFISAVIQLAISTLFNILLYNVIDPGAKEVIKEETIKALAASLQKFNLPASEINASIDKIRNEDTLGVGAQLKGFFFSLAGTSVLGVILALIFKSRPTFQE